LSFASFGYIHHSCNLKIMATIRQKKPFQLYGPFSYRLRSLGNVFRVTFSVTARRLVRGPLLPGWSWDLETSMRFMQLQLDYTHRLSDIRKSREYQDSLVFFSKALEQVDVTPAPGPVAARWIVPDKAVAGFVVLYLHGGGYVYYSRMHDNILAVVAEATEMRLYAPDYRLAPESHFPAQIEDAMASYHWLLENGYPPEHIIVAGDSAGGNLVLSLLVAIKAAGDPMPSAAFCIAPWTDMGNSGKSMTDNELYDLIDMRSAELWSGWYCGGTDPRDPRISPDPAGMAGMPPVYIQIGSADILIDQVMEFCSRAREAGADVRLDVWRNMPHDFQGYGKDMTESREALEKIGRFVRESLGN
jgi:acetyl esterase/lipase